LPPLEREKLGAWGFSAILERDIARAALLTEIENHDWIHLQHIADRIIRGYGLAKEDENIKPPYEFVRNEEGNLTLFAESFNIPGNACFLFYPPDSLEELRKKEKSNLNWIEFNPHNVDSSSQQLTLASIWETWATGVYGILKREVCFR